MSQQPAPQGSLAISSVDNLGKVRRIRIHVPLNKNDVYKLLKDYYPPVRSKVFTQRLQEFLVVTDSRQRKYAGGWVLRYLLLQKSDVVDPNMVKKVNRLLDGSLITVYRLATELALSKDSLYRYAAGKRNIIQMQISVGMVLARYYDLVFNNVPFDTYKSK